MPAQPIPTPSGAVVVVNSDWFPGTTTFFMAMLAAGTPMSYAQGEALNRLMLDTVTAVVAQVSASISPYMPVEPNGTPTVGGIPLNTAVVAIALAGRMYLPDEFTQIATEVTMANEVLFSRPALLFLLPNTSTEPDPETNEES